MKVRARFAQVRDGVMDHHPKMTFPEIAVFHHLLNRANRMECRGDVGLCPGLGFRQLATDMGKSRNAIKRALRGLASRGYLLLRKDGIFIPKFIPESGSREDPPLVPPVTHPRVPRGPTPGTSGDPPPGLKRTHQRPQVVENKDDAGPLYVRGDVRDKKKNNKKEASNAAANWPSWYSGIEWNKPKNRVDFKPEAEAGLSEHLKELAAEENLKLLTKQELQRGWGRLNGWLLRNRQCRGPKSLPPIVVNWFENDLRDPYRSRSPTSKRQQTDDIFDEALRIAEEKEREERND